MDWSPLARSEDASPNITSPNLTFSTFGEQQDSPVFQNTPNLFGSKFGGKQQTNEQTNACTRLLFEQTAETPIFKARKSKHGAGEMDDKV